MITIIMGVSLPNREKENYFETNYRQYKLEHRYAVFTGYSTTPSLLQEYKEEYGIEKLIIYKSSEVGIHMDTTWKSIKVISDLD